MKKVYKNLLFIVLILLVPVSAFSFSFGADNHSFNPALMGTGARPWFETGVTATAGFGNNYFSVLDFLTDDPSQPLVIDLDDLYAVVKEDGGFFMNVNAFSEFHSVVRIWNIGLGAYATIDAVFDTSLPPELFRFLAEGNDKNDEFSDSGDILARSFFEAGVYSGYRWKNYQFGVKVGQYLPLLYSDTAGYDMEIKIKEASEPDDLVAEGHIELSGKVYSVLDLEEFENPELMIDDPMKLLEYGGYKIDAGVVYAKQPARPLWGVSVSVPITPAIAPYAYDIKGRVELKVENPLGSIDWDEVFGDGDENGNGDGDEDEMFEVVEDLDFVRDYDAPDKEITAPIKAGAFYRLTLLPLVDVIPHVEMIFDDPMRINGGLTLTGSFFPLSWLSFGMGYQNESWVSAASLDMNLRLVEIGVRATNSAMSIGDVLSLKSPAVTVHAAVGL